MSTPPALPAIPQSVSENLTASERRKRFKEIERFIRKLDRRTVAGLRDRAILGLLGNRIVSLDSAVRMRVSDITGSEREGGSGSEKRDKSAKSFCPMLSTCILTHT